MTYHRYNPHPDGRKVNDCVIRAFTAVLENMRGGVSYDEVLREYTDCWHGMMGLYPEADGAPNYSAYRTHIEHFGVISAVSISFGMRVGLKLIEPLRHPDSLGRRALFHPDLLPSGPAIIALRRHLVATIDGEVHDSWNSLGKGRRAIRWILVPRASDYDADEYWRRLYDRRVRMYGKKRAQERSNRAKIGRNWAKIRPKLPENRTKES